MKETAYSILYSAHAILRDKGPQGITPDTAEACANLIASALNLEETEAAPSAPIAPPVTAAELRRASADPRPEAPAPEPRKKPVVAATPAAPDRREKLISQIQAVIDEAHTDDATIALQRIKSAGIYMGNIADLLGVKIHAVYNIPRGKNKAAEYKFWKIFSKPNITPKEEA